jgi:hypothetical protein
MAAFRALTNPSKTSILKYIPGTDWSKRKLSVCLTRLGMNERFIMQGFEGLLFIKKYRIYNLSLLRVSVNSILLSISRDFFILFYFIFSFKLRIVRSRDLRRLKKIKTWCDPRNKQPNIIKTPDQFL